MVSTFFYLTASDGRHNFNSAFVFDERAGPLRATHHLAVYRYRYAAGFDAKALQKCFYCLREELFFIAIDAYHERCKTKLRACFAASGASVTPWR